MNILRNMPNFEPKITGYPDVELRSTSPLHRSRDGSAVGSVEAQNAELGTFGKMVLNALGQTNNQIIDSQLLQQQAVVSPDSVDPSTLVISLLKADMSLSLSKAVVDRATAAYKELTTLR